MTVLPRSVHTILRPALGLMLGITLAYPTIGWAETPLPPAAHSAPDLHDATPLNAWDATDAPDDVQGAQAITPQGTPLGQVGAVRMDPRPGVMEIAALRIDPAAGKTAPYWVEAGRIWRLPASIVVGTKNSQTALVP